VNRPTGAQADRPTLSVDAITASVEYPSQDLTDRLARIFHADASPCRPLPGRGYDTAAVLLAGKQGDVLGVRERPVARIETGSRFQLPSVYAEGTESYDTPALYAALCEHFPGLWFPSRLDVAADWEDPALFDRIRGILVKFALDRDVKISQAGDWVRGCKRTLYLYSRQSRFFVRLYEYRQHHGYGPAVRLELEAKPKHREQRATLAAWSPADILRSCPATHYTLDQLGVGCADQLTLSAGVRVPATVARDLSFLANAAYPALLRMIRYHAGDLASALAHVLRYREDQDLQQAQLRHVARLLPGTLLDINTVDTPVTPCYDSQTMAHSSTPLYRVS
jgi:hypothetical protein